MTKVFSRFICAGFVLVLAIANVGKTEAALTTFTQAMGVFTHDSDTVSPAFNAALGGSYTHLSFAGAASSDGASYSSDVTFSTLAGTFGGSNSSSVNFSNSLGEIGPAGTWDGILNIDFNGNYVTTVGFGLVLFSDPFETIRVYDDANNLIGTFNNQLSDDFSLWGVTATAGGRIGRIELDGNFFAIQDISFSDVNSNAVPEPTSIVMLGLGGMGMGLAAWRRRRAVVA